MFLFGTVTSWCVVTMCSAMFILMLAVIAALELWAVTWLWVLMCCWCWVMRVVRLVVASLFAVVLIGFALVATSRWVERLWWWR